MKKEYLILIAVIICLSAYLALKKDNQVNYELPVLGVVDAKAIDTIEITRADKTLVLSGTKEKWTIGDKAYPVDQASIDNIMDTIKGLSLSALVSETSDLVRYELDKGNGIHVKALGKGKVIREFSLGKTSPSLSHTFVMLADDTRIYQADKNFRTHFDKSLDDFRDKVVLSFKTPEITGITLEKEGVKRKLTLKTQKKDEKEIKTWQADDIALVDKEAVQNLVSSLSRLDCQAFAPEARADQLKKESPICKINLETKEGLSLNLYENKASETMAGTSSFSPYAFELASYKASDIISYIDKILGLKTEEKTSEKN